MQTEPSGLLDQPQHFKDLRFTVVLVSCHHLLSVFHELRCPLMAAEFFASSSLRLAESAITASASSLKTFQQKLAIHILEVLYCA
jgi:hypothetical protein